jgi:hypothetical protein
MPIVLIRIISAASSYYFESQIIDNWITTFNQLTLVTYSIIINFFYNNEPNNLIIILMISFTVSIST